MAMSLFNVSSLLAAATLLSAKTALAAPTGLPLNYGSVFGLQRGMHLQKKAVVVKEEADDMEPLPKVGSDNRKDVKSDEVLGSDMLSLALEHDDAASPDWLDGTSLGLQRGFEVTKKATKPLQQTSAVASPARSESKLGPLGLQRGFHVKKAVVVDVEDSDDEGTATPSWRDSTTLGLQRGFRVQKKAVPFTEASALLGSREQTNSTAGSTQSRLHKVAENRTFVV